MAESRKVVCPHCEGWGHVAQGRCDFWGNNRETIRHRRCPNCQGKGMVKPK